MTFKAPRCGVNNASDGLLHTRVDRPVKMVCQQTLGPEALKTYWTVSSKPKRARSSSQYLRQRCSSAQRFSTNSSRMSAQLEHLEQLDVEILA